MTTLERTILATVCYYNALDYPLTAWEIRRFLVNPFSLSEASGRRRHEEASYEGVLKALKRKALGDFLVSADGLYALKGREELFAGRAERQTRSLKGWRRARRAAWFLQGVPFARLIVASGSLALSNMKKESDLDFFIVAASRRNWTVRLGVVVVMQLLGVRRHGKKVANRVCLNHFITEEAMTIPHQTMYTAHLYAHLVPLVDREETPTVLADFWHANTWIEEFLAFPPFLRDDDHYDSGLEYRRRVKRSGLLRAWARFWEVIFSGWLGDKVESLAKKIQLRWMTREHREPAVPKADDGRVVISDTELAFHPGSPEVAILARFNEHLVEYGLHERG